MNEMDSVPQTSPGEDTEDTSAASLLSLVNLLENLRMEVESVSPSKLDKKMDKIIKEEEDFADSVQKMHVEAGNQLEKETARNLKKNPKKPKSASIKGDSINVETLKKIVKSTAATIEEAFGNTE